MRNSESKPSLPPSVQSPQGTRRDTRRKQARPHRTELFQNNFSKEHRLTITAIMANSAVISSVRKTYHALAPFLHEKARRRWAAREALALGRGGISVVAAATELSHPTIRRGIAELQAGDDSPPVRPSRIIPGFAVPGAGVTRSGQPIGPYSVTSSGSSIRPRAAIPCLCCCGHARVRVTWPTRWPSWGMT
jgi:hypothetical protein